MDIVEATHAYERWMKRFFDPIADDLRRKHEQMGENPFAFMRATFYRWAQNWEALPKKVRTAPIVLGAGDIHVENFGTWRDAEGRLVWGVNDFDEAVQLPYTSDLVRLATSAALAHLDGQLAISTNRICSSVLVGYTASLRHGGRAVVLDSGPAWLRKMVVADQGSIDRFWGKLLALPNWTGSVHARARELLSVGDDEPKKMVHRVSGIGSLGRPRLAAFYVSNGGYLAREVKARTPSAWLWAHGADEDQDPLPRIWRGAIRSQDPYLSVTRRWIVRRLAPDCIRINLGDIPKQHKAALLVTAMGWELGNIHLGSAPARPILKHLAALNKNWLLDSSVQTTHTIQTDYGQWARSSNVPSS
jgi:hypothetical protein